MRETKYPESAQIRAFMENPTIADDILPSDIHYGRGNLAERDRLVAWVENVRYKFEPSLQRAVYEADQPAIPPGWRESFENAYEVEVVDNTVVVTTDGPEGVPFFVEWELEDILIERK